ncbi:hypothetical protein [Neptuniibacter sp. QD37_11]|uniref:hypothetical protein n=1 Tax=Neptuniibacter sp. QD37_11 TaxID=3398209 RepID=UPI0039F5DC74
MNNFINNLKSTNTKRNILISALYLAIFAILAISAISVTDYGKSLARSMLGKQPSPYLLKAEGYSFVNKNNTWDRYIIQEHVAELSLYVDGILFSNLNALVSINNTEYKVELGEFNGNSCSSHDPVEDKTQNVIDRLDGSDYIQEAGRIDIWLSKEEQQIIPPEKINDCMGTVMRVLVKTLGHITERDSAKPKNLAKWEEARKKAGLTDG